MQNLYPLNKVSKKTGLSSILIRAWEKRYGVVTPQRSESNRRLFTESDVEKLNLLKTATQNGHSIGNVAKLSIRELQDLVLREEKDQTYYFEKSVPDNYKIKIQNQIENLLNAVNSLDSQKLSSRLNYLSIEFSNSVIIEEVIIPVLKKIGELWEEGEIRIVHEHFATSTIRNYLAKFINESLTPENRKTIVIVTPAEQFHELGAVISAAVAVSEGWRISYLGANLPAEEIAYAVNHLKASVVCLSLIYPNDDPDIEKELKKLKELIPQETKIMLGGRAMWNYRDILLDIDAVFVNNSFMFRKELDKIKD